MSFHTFFAAAFPDKRQPYGYQCRLAYFEALFRAADAGASAKASKPTA